MPGATDKASKSKSLLKGKKHNFPNEKSLQLSEYESAMQTEVLSRLITIALCFFGGLSLLCLYKS